MTIGRVLSKQDFRQIEKVQRDLDKTVTTSHKILPHALLGTVSLRNHDDKYKKFGLRFIRYCQHTIRLERIRAACTTATQKFISGLKHPVAAQREAVLKFGKAECGELSWNAFYRLSELKPILVLATSHQMTWVEGEKTLEIYNDNITSTDHLFLIFGLSENDVQTCKTIKDLLKLGDFYIFDPLFNIFCHARHYDKQAIDLKNYVKAFDIRHVKFIVTKKDDITRLEKEVGLVYRNAIQLVSTTKAPPQLWLVWNFTVLKVANDCFPNVVKFLEDCFPKINWEKDFNSDGDWSVYFTGNQKKVQKMAKIFSRLGCNIESEQIKDSPEWLFKLNDPEPLELRVIAYTSFFFKEETFQLSRIIAQYCD